MNLQRPSGHALCSHWLGLCSAPALCPDPKALGYMSSACMKEPGEAAGERAVVLGTDQMGLGRDADQLQLAHRD